MANGPWRGLGQSTGGVVTTRHIERLNQVARISRLGYNRMVARIWPRKNLSAWSKI